MNLFRSRSIEFSTPRPVVILLWSVVIGIELGLVLAYVSIRGAELSLFHLYPFVWINLSIWAVWTTTPIATSNRNRLIAGAVAVGYFALLGYVSGLFGRGHESYGHTVANPEYLYGLELAVTLPPGYGPALLYSGPLLMLAVVPYMLIGYVALAYLIYVTILDSVNATVSGLLGLFTCIGCSWPILASIVSGVGGASGAAATAVYSQSYEISTIAFVLTVALLYWRPFTR